MKKLIITSIFLLVISSCFSQEFKQGGYIIVATANLVDNMQNAKPKLTETLKGVFVKDDTKRTIALIFDSYMVDMVKWENITDSVNSLIYSGKSQMDDTSRSIVFIKKVKQKINDSDYIIAIQRGNGAGDLFWVKYVGG